MELCVRCGECLDELIDTAKIPHPYSACQGLRGEILRFPPAFLAWAGDVPRAKAKSARAGANPFSAKASVRFHYRGLAVVNVLIVLNFSS